MNRIKDKEFMQKSVETLNSIINMLVNLPSVKLKSLPGESTALIINDMINGFTRQGSLKSDRIEALIPDIVKLSRICEENGIIRLALADCHNVDSAEFESYPSHCMAGTHESEVVDEIKEQKGYTLIPKNSTNGFLEERFQEWLSVNRGITNFIVTGDCTDICIMQFALTLKAYFNMQDRRVDIIVPIDCVGTYDIGIHYGDLMDLFALFNMMENGIRVVRSIQE